MAADERKEAKILNRTLLITLSLILAAGCSEDAGLKPFSSDGCSLFPDASLINEDDWCACCFEHDIAYWRGGTAEQREMADTALKLCVSEATGDAVLANLMYEGIRFGGSPYFYNWYRWGYGWSYDRKYRALTAVEAETANAYLESYRSSATDTVCGGGRARAGDGY